MSFESAPLRIALISLHTSPVADPGTGDAGGMNVVVRAQAEALAARGHAVDILTRRSSADEADATPLSPRLTLRSLRAGPLHPVPKGEHEAFIDAFGSRMAELGPYDIIHSHHWFSGMAAVPVARERGIPHVQSFHSIAADPATPLASGERPESPGRMAGEQWLATHSDAIVAISRAEAHTVETRLGGSPDRIVIVPPGVDADMFHPPHRERGRDRGYALAAGRLQPLKGLDLAIAAIADVPESLRPDLVIAGAPSADFTGYDDELRSLATSRGVENRVRFVGAQSRTALASLMREASIVLVPSHSETYGLVALEAAACGAPVVAAASGGLSEAVADGETGYVLASRDSGTWAEAIVRILSDPSLARRMSVAARQRAEHFDWMRSARGLEAVYDRLTQAGALEPACRPAAR